MTTGKQLPWQPKKELKYLNSKQKQIFVNKKWNKSALTVECISKSSILSYIKIFNYLMRIAGENLLPQK